MKKKIVLWVTLFILASAAGCGKAEGDQIQEPATESFMEEQPEEQTGEESPEVEKTDTGFSFADLSGWVFYFSSGAGGWYTELSVNGDGTLQGTYMDSDMGDSGDTYPDGTVYYCEFTGMFEQSEKVDAYTYKIRLADLAFKQEPNKEEIIDGVRYVYSTANGLDGGEDFYVYLPGAGIPDLPEDYRSWVGYYNPESMTETELSFYGLYNINTGDGFSSNYYEVKSLSERIAQEISYAEEQDTQLREQLQNDTNQTDMNFTAQELYETWDNALNSVWKLLESELDDARMEALREEERTWIASKEEAVNAVSQEYEGGSMREMEVSLKAAELTKERVYELAEYGTFL